MAVDRVVLHVGMSKAGSTAIQQSLWWNADWLRQRACHVLQTGTIDMHAIHTQLFADTADTEAHDMAIEAEVAALDDRSWTVVLSTEEAWLFKDRVLARVRDSIRRWFGDVDLHIVVYLRNQSDWVQSSVRQTMRAGLQRPSWLLDLHRPLPDISREHADLLLQQPYYATYPERLAHLADTLLPQRITTRPYVRDRLVHDDAALDFVSTIGYAPDQQFVRCPEGINRSFSLEAIAVLADIDDRAIPQDDRLDVMEALRSYSEQGGQRSILRAATQLIAQHGYGESNRALIAEHPHLDGLQFSLLPPARPLDQAAVDRCRAWFDTLHRVPFRRWGHDIDALPHLSPRSTPTSIGLQVRTPENISIRWGRPLKIRLHSSYRHGIGTSHVSINGHHIPDLDLATEPMVLSAPMYRPGWVLDFEITGSPLLIEGFSFV